MSEEYAVYQDRNRHTYLQYRDAGKTRHFITMCNGSIDCVQLSAKDYLRFKKYEKHSPQHFAEVYLSSFLGISRQARVILRGVLGYSSESGGPEERASFTGTSVSLEEIAQVNNWEPSKCRKFLRKLVEKPGGRWAWPPEEAEKITVMLKECFTNDSKS